MANSIILKSKAVTEVGTDIAFSVGLAMSDGTNEIAAKFSIDTDETTLPMIGITEYGKLVGLVASSSTSTPFSVTATPLDGSSALEVDSTVAAVLAADPDESIASA